MSMSDPLILWFDETGMNDILRVGGKGASLGEMYQNLSGLGVIVPNGFTVSVAAYWEFFNSQVPEGTWDQVVEIEGLEKIRERAIKSDSLIAAVACC